MRILIANRGEIARRIIRTATRLGHQTVAAYADPDRSAPFVAEATTATRLGPADAARSYLSIEALLAAAQRTGADALHPGYGFLAERADLARAVQQQGMTWVGPHPDAIERMGSKIEARRLAAEAGVPVIPGFDRSQDPADLAAAARELGYPVLIKASAGGGGKGIRVVHDPADFARALDEARSEAGRTFGDPAVIVERFVLRPRHIEVQVVGDTHGRVIDLGTRECSLQRRYQKLIEEAPAPRLDRDAERALRRSAVELAASIGYDSAGTVEFVVDADTGEHLFLEMNTRLQVEHPVTELVTGLDLVELQLVVAEGRPLPVPVDGVAITGHAFEARINAEDAWAGSIPQIGTVTGLRLPDGVRWDAGIEVGSEVTPHYDPMVAKLIVGGPDRDTARRRLVAALDQLVVAGVGTNGGLLRWLLTRPEVVAAEVTTRFVDEAKLPPPPPPSEAAVDAARAWQRHRDEARATGGTWARIGSVRLTPHRPSRSLALALPGDGEVFDVALDDPPATPAAVAGGTSGGPPAGAAAPGPPGGGQLDAAGGVPTAGAAAGSSSSDAAGPAVVLVDLDQRLVAVNRRGQTTTFRVLSRQERWRGGTGGAGASPSALTAPFPAVVAEVRVRAGEHVHEGQVLVVLEAMKMLHSLAAGGDGTVDAVHAVAGAQVASGQVLVTFEAPDEPAPDGEVGS